MGGTKKDIPTNSLVPVNKAILCFSGLIGSGKTTISSRTAEILQWKYTSFGKIVRQEAAKKGLDNQSRNILQQTGKDLIKAGWVDFCKAVLSDVDWKYGEGLVIDGIRHIEAMDHLKQLVNPMPIFLIHISLDNQERHKRLRTRAISDKKLIEQHDQDETEAQVNNILPSLADLIIDGSLPIEELAFKIVNWLYHSI